MKQTILSLIAIVILSYFGHSQTPILVDVPENASSLRLSCNGDQEAGSVSIGNYIGYAQSNDIDLTKMYLCAGDRVPIIHNQDMLLMGDPDPSTPPQVGYGFYTCPPTITGEDLVTVSGDQCLVPNNNPSASQDFYIVTDGEADFSLLLNNNGSLIENFNNGDPGSWFFAPMTFDRLDILGNGRFNAVFEDDPSSSVEGPCVDVSTEDFFEVVYLTPFAITDFTASKVNDTTCRGEFVITGGLPEYESDKFYSIHIYSESNPSIEVDIQGTDYSHGDLVQFEVDFGGNYIIEVSDEKNCSNSFQVTMNCSNELIITLPTETHDVGSNFCIPVEVSNFDSLQGVNFTLHFDPKVIEYTSNSGFNIPNSGLIIDDSNVDKGYISVLWQTDDFSSGTTVPDGTAMLDLCFIVHAEAEHNDMSPLYIDGFPVSLEADNYKFEDSGIIINNGKITIRESDDVLYTATSCGTAPGEANGTISLEVFNTIQPVTVELAGPSNGTYNIPIGQDKITIPNLLPGEYLIKITDSRSLSFTDQITINDQIPYTPIFDLNVLNPSCDNRKDGEVHMVNIEASGNYDISWSNNIYDTDKISRLSSGKYGVTLTDEFGCEAIASRVLSYIPIQATYDTINTTCLDSQDGVAVISAIGGQPKDGTLYDFLWSNGHRDTEVESSRIDTLSVGQYTVTVTDNKNCNVGVVTFNIDTDNKMHLSDVRVEHLRCFNSADGAIRAEVAYNKPGATIQVDIRGVDVPYSNTTVGQTTINETNLEEGVYNVIVTIQEVPGCFLDTLITVEAPDSMFISRKEIIDQTCDGNNGSIKISVEGGTATNGNYSFEWSDNLAGDSTITNLEEGAYRVTVTDENGCSIEEQYTINKPFLPRIVTIVSSKISCFGMCDGMLTSLVEEGTFPIDTIIWKYSGNTEYTDSVKNACAGMYEIIVKDEGECSDTLVYEFDQPTAIDTISTQVVQPGCNEDSGSIEIKMKGGTSPYIYNWEQPNIGNTNNPKNLPPGEYTVNILDRNNCGPLVLSFTIEEIGNFDVQFTNIQEVSCHGNCDGSATAVVRGGNGGNYEFEWEDGTITAINNNLCSGETFVIVKEGECKDTFTISLEAKDSIEIETTEILAPMCFDDENGIITVRAIGGSPDYQYAWSNNSIGSTIDNLPAGEYTITVTDSEGCTEVKSYTLDQPEELRLEINEDETQHISCNDQDDGRITLNTNGGNNTTYTYQWQPNVSTSNQASALSNGLYHITVTDANGCIDTTSYLIEKSEEITFDIVTEVSISCDDDSARIQVDNIQGGIGSDYLLYINGVAYDILETHALAAGNYTFMVEDETGCIGEQELTIENPLAFEIELKDEYVVPIGNSVVVTPTFINQTVPLDTFTWNPTEKLDCDTCLSPSVTPSESFYLTIEAIASNGCVAMATTYIKVENAKNVYIPNAFSPNGDGINDYFRLYGDKSIHSIKSMKIFDRWGALLFEASNIDAIQTSTYGWNGFCKGKIVDPGTYTYSIDILFDDGVVVNYHGNLTVTDTKN